MSPILPVSTDGELGKSTSVQHPGWRFDQQYPKQTGVAVESPPKGISGQYGNGFLDNNGNPPTKYDVLLGRGKFVQHHKGNIRLHTIIHSFITRYIRGDKRSKTQVSADILHLIRANGERSGRFLKFSNRSKTWTEVEDSVARQKVGHAIRDYLRAPVLRERKSIKRFMVRAYDTKRNLEKMTENREQDYAEMPIRRGLSAEDLASLKQLHKNQLPLPAVRTNEEISTSSGDTDKSSSISSDSNTDEDKKSSSVDDTSGCTVIPNSTRDVPAEDASFFLTKETTQAPMMYPLCTSTRNVVGQIVNMQDIPPELLASSLSFVTFMSGMEEESDEE
jgi:hypothetical protein